MPGPDSGVTIVRADVTQYMGLPEALSGRCAALSRLRPFVSSAQALEADGSDGVHMSRVLILVASANPTTWQQLQRRWLRRHKLSSLAEATSPYMRGEPPSSVQLVTAHHCQVAPVSPPVEWLTAARRSACSNVLLIATGTRPALDPFGPFNVDYQGTVNLVTAAKAQGYEKVCSNL